MTSDAGQIWWTEIANPGRFIEDVQTALVDGRSVLLQIGLAFPYRWTFRDEISHWMDQSNITTEQIDCETDYTGDDIGAFLVNRLAPQFLPEYLRHRTPQLLRDNKIFSNRLIWVKGIPKEAVLKWTEFVSEFRSKSTESGVFLLEVKEMEKKKSFSHSITGLQYASYITDDDLRLYISILSENCSMQPSLKQYAVNLITALCNKDSETAGKMLEELDLERDDPTETLRTVLGTNFLDSPQINCKGHPFALLYEEAYDQLDKRIWIAQVQTVYPMIEMERLTYINRWYSEILESLKTPFRREGDNSPHYLMDIEGNQITDPYEIEIGQLSLLITVRNYDDATQYQLYIPDESLRNRIRFLRTCRNQLAHLKKCETAECYQMLTGSFLRTTKSLWCKKYRA